MPASNLSMRALVATLISSSFVLTASIDEVKPVQVSWIDDVIKSVRVAWISAWVLLILAFKLALEFLIAKSKVSNDGCFTSAAFTRTGDDGGDNLGEIGGVSRLDTYGVDVSSSTNSGKLPG